MPRPRPRLTDRELAAVIEATACRLAGDLDDLTDAERAALEAADDKLKAIRNARHHPGYPAE